MESAPCALHSGVHLCGASRGAGVWGQQATTCAPATTGHNLCSRSCTGTQPGLQGNVGTADLVCALGSGWSLQVAVSAAEVWPM